MAGRGQGSGLVLDRRICRDGSDGRFYGLRSVQATVQSRYKIRDTENHRGLLLNNKLDLRWFPERAYQPFQNRSRLAVAVQPLGLGFRLRQCLQTSVPGLLRL